MKFWDTSALIPLCLHERQTASLRKLAQDDEAIAAWWFRRLNVCQPSPGGAFLVRPPGRLTASVARTDVALVIPRAVRPRRTGSTPPLVLLARSPGGLRSRTPRDGIHE